jgi:hypothetical protein
MKTRCVIVGRLPTFAPTHAVATSQIKLSSVDRILNIRIYTAEYPKCTELCPDKRQLKKLVSGDAPFFLIS